MPFSKFHLHVASILGGGTFFDGFDSLSISVALPVLIVLLHIGPVQAGMLVSAAFLGSVIGAFAVGYASEIIGRKRAFATALVLFGISTAAFAFTREYHAMLALRLVQGLGLGAEVPVAGAMFNEFLRGKTRGRVAAFYQSLYSWGSLAPALAGLFFYQAFGQSFGWRAIFLFGGIPALIGVYAFFRLPESPRWLSEQGRRSEADAVVTTMERAYAPGTLAAPDVRVHVNVRPTRFGELLSSAYARRSTLIWTQCFMFSIAANTLGAWLPTLYARVGHITTSFALLLTLLGGLIQVVTAYVFALLVDRVGRKPLFLVGFGCIGAGAALGIVFVAGLHTTAWPALFAAGAVMLVGTSIHLNGIYLYIAELFPTRMRAWATSTGQGVSRFAGIVGPMLLGILLAGALGIAGVYTMFLIVAVLGFATMFFLGIETKQRTLEELAT
ncbi:MAG: MFS transporter [Vulcanimicrobiaceae bacterium]